MCSTLHSITNRSTGASGVDDPASDPFSELHIKVATGPDHCEFDRLPGPCSVCEIAKGIARKPMNSTHAEPWRSVVARAFATLVGRVRGRCGHGLAVAGDAHAFVERNFGVRRYG